MQPHDPDASIVARFLNLAIKNVSKSNELGRPVFDDMEHVELRYPGSKNVGVYPATSFSHWAVDPETGEQVKVTYAERFPRQYRQFKAHEVQTKSGTPLDYAPFLTDARRAELRAQNIYTVEALAAIEGMELKNLGPGGREFKNQATAFLERSAQNAPNLQMAAEMEAMRARMAILEEDNARLQEQKAGKPRPPEQFAQDQFDEMTVDQLRKYISYHTGQAVRGSPTKAVLARMARELNVAKSDETEAA